MRYILVDRIVHLEPGRELRACKHVTATDGLAVTYDDGMPALPGAMLLEAMAQAAGLLVVRSLETPAQPVLAKVELFEAAGLVRAGDRVDLDAVIDGLRGEGCRARITASVDGRTIATASILLALVAIEDPQQRARLAGRLAAIFPDWFEAPASVGRES